MTHAINWDLIRQPYDQIIKYATALLLGTADAETILRRFTKSNLQHPTYQALLELGAAKSHTSYSGEADDHMALPCC